MAAIKYRLAGFGTPSSTIATTYEASNTRIARSCSLVNQSFLCLRGEFDDSLNLECASFSLNSSSQVSI